MDKKKGQATVEAVLLLVLLVSLTILIIQTTMHDGEWMKKIIEAPGNHIRGMSIAGTWKPCADFPSNCSAAINEYPTQELKTLQVQGDDPR